jgi:hypothetical protein
MVKTTRGFVGAGVVAIFMLITVGASVTKPQAGTGYEWVLWTPEQRSSFIDGFWTGYVMGTRRACDVTDDLFEVGKMHRVGEDPSARCLARLELYSKDARLYTAVLTDFYTQHPEYRNIPVVYLMRFLTDSKFKTADELYQMALKGELRTIF